MTKQLNITSKETLPWIEKYRPSTLDEIISHSVIIDTLNNFIKYNELPHLLFHGPPGSGKSSVVIAVAKALYKDKFDIMTMEINASEERGIEVVRNRIIQFANSKSLSFDDDDEQKNTFKLIILDEADAMTSDAQASLRRVIEKYTRNVRFCLICNYIKKIDIAIQSRCTCFRFAPLKDIYIKERLYDIAEKEYVKYTDDGLDTIVKRSKGDMRKVLNILQSVSMAYEEVNENNVDKCLGYPCGSDILLILKNLISQNFTDSYSLLKDYKETHGFSLSDIIVEIHEYLIDILLKKSKYPDINLTNKQIQEIIKYLGKIDYNIANATDETIQFAAFVGVFKMIL